VFQIAFVVPELEPALERYSRMLGVESWRCYTFGSHLHRTAEYRGRPNEFSSGLALSDGVPQFELVEPREGSSTHRDWLAEGRTGVHHLGVVVDSMERAVETMEQAGFPVVQYGAGFGLDGDGSYAYFDTVDALGLLLEAVEPPARMIEPEFRWP
jgi:catechol 2,3-dioxygenase-like lactoylglutathione lyase family enzyme